MAQNVAAPHPLDVRLMHTSANLLIVLAVLGALGFGLLMLAQSSWFAIRSVRIIGDTQHNNIATVRATALPRLKGTYLTMDLRAAQAAFEAVPWVRSAVVRRVWPHQLVAELREHKPVALWERDEGEDHLVGDAGEVFEVNLGDVEDLSFPTLRGPQGSSAQVLAMLQRLNPIVERLGGAVDRLSLSERGSWRLELERGTVIELGRGSEDDVVLRTQRFASSVTQVIAGYGARAVETADLRHQDGYALRLAGVSVDTKPVAPGSKTSKTGATSPAGTSSTNSTTSANSTTKRTTGGDAERATSSNQGPGKGR